MTEHDFLMLIGGWFLGFICMGLLGANCDHSSERSGVWRCSDRAYKLTRI